DCFAKQIGVLRDVADCAAQGCKRPLAQRLTIEKHGPVWGFPKTRNKCRQCRFSAASRPDNGKRGTRGDLQRNVVKNSLFAVSAAVRGRLSILGTSGKCRGITECQTAKLDCAFGCNFRGNLCRTVVYARLCCQNEIQAAHGSGATLKNVRYP